MKALQLKKYGQITGNVEIRDVAQPAIGDNQVLIKVRAAATNPMDALVIEGQFKPLIKLDLPSSLGLDVAGEIVEKGARVEALNVHDAVYARVREDAMGTFAEYVAVDAEIVARKPTNIDFEQAAGLPLAGCTALQAFDLAELKSGDTVLIHAGSGGVGSLAIQYAKAKGATVFTTTSTANVEWVKALGADRVIDYKKEDYREIVSDLDLVVDTLGGDETLAAFDVIKHGGSVMSLVGDIDEDAAQLLELGPVIRFMLRMKARKTLKKAKSKSARYKFVAMRPNRVNLDRITQMVETGKMTPVLDDNRFELSNAVGALIHQKSGRAKGKIIIRVA